MKKLLISLILTAMATAFAAADTIILKSGEKVEGDIQTETDDYVIIEIQVSATIKDRKTIQRTDIEKIEKLTADGIAFEKIKELIPSPPLHTNSENQGRVKAAHQIVDRFATSPHYADAEEILATLKEESTKAAEGYIKVGDDWVSPEDRQKDSTAVDAKIALYQMQVDLKAEKPINVLRDFDKFEVQYKGTEAFVPALDAAQSALLVAAAKVKTAINDFAYTKQERERKWALMPENERMEVEKLYAQQQEDFNKRIDAEKKEKIKWLTVNPDSEASLKAVAELIKKEVTRLAGFDKNVLAEGADLIVQAREEVDKGNYSAATTILREASVVIGRTPYITQIETSIREAQKAEAQAIQAAKDTRSQEAIAKMQASKTSGDDTAPDNVADDPLAAQRERRKASMQKDAGAAPSGAAKKGTTAAGQKPSSAAVSTPAPASGGGGGISFQTVMMILAGIMIAVTAVALFLKKKQEE
jgi:hypothetical protein